MAELDPVAFDLPTLASLAGGAAADHLLARLHDAGYEGVRASHGYVIQLLVEDRPTVGQVADRLGVTQQAASKQVAELEALGIVVRVPDPADSRVRHVELTPRGRDVLERGRRERLELERAVRRRVGDLDAAKRALVALLEVSGGLEGARRRRVRLPKTSVVE
jgi:DNA-binding MarR family transcriptional regulator